MIVNVRRAKIELSRLLARAEAGEEVVIARRGRPIARLVPWSLGAGVNPELSGERSPCPTVSSIRCPKKN